MRFFFWGSKSKRDSQRVLKHATSSDGNGSVKSKTSLKSAKTAGSGSSSKSQTTKQSKHAVGVEQAPVKKQVQDNKYVQAVKTCMEKMNSYVPEDPDLYAQRILDCYDSPDTPLIAEDGEQYKATDLAELCVNIYKSFPDFHMTYGKVTYIAKTPKQGKNTYSSKKEEDDDIVAEVELDSLIVSGTHTGAPYTIAPGVLPELPPSGKYVQNDEQRMVFYLNKKAEIVKSQLISLGVHTGAIGLYTLAGGDVSPLFAKGK